MEASQSLDIFSDKKYWTPARKKLLFALFETSWDQETLSEKIGKKKRTIARYLREPAFLQAMTGMTAQKELLFAIRVLSNKERILDLLEKELIKRFGKLRFKNLLKIREAMEGNSQEFLSSILKETSKELGAKSVSLK